MSKTIVSFILDETGSMSSVKQQTIDGFNEYVNTLRQNSKGVRFTLTRFNSDKLDVEYEAVKLKKVVDLTAESYQPAACTPLYDAIGSTIASLSKSADSNVLVVIQTDGAENDSREYNQRQIFDLVREKKAQGWTFVFLGADQDAWAASQKLGLDEGNVLSYSSAQTSRTFSKVAQATSAYVSRGAQLTATFWSDTVDSDAS